MTQDEVNNLLISGGWAILENWSEVTHQTELKELSYYNPFLRIFEASTKIMADVSHAIEEVCEAHSQNPPILSYSENLRTWIMQELSPFCVRMAEEGKYPSEIRLLQAFHLVLGWSDDEMIRWMEDAQKSERMPNLLFALPVLSRVSGDMSLYEKLCANRPKTTQDHAA